VLETLETLETFCWRHWRHFGDIGDVLENSWRINGRHSATVSSRDTGKGSKNNKANVSEGSSSTWHMVKTGDAMLLIATDSMVCVM
jgi:hypothetical protein